MNDLGLSQYCVDIQTFTPSQLMNAFAGLTRNAEEVKSQLATKLANYRSVLATQYDELFPLFTMRFGCRQLYAAKGPIPTTN